MPLELDAPVVPHGLETLQRAAQSFCACCQQSLLRRSFSGSSSFGLPFFLLFNGIPGKGDTGGECACEGVANFFPEMDCKGNKTGKAWPDALGWG